MAAPYSYVTTYDGPFDDENYEVRGAGPDTVAVCQTRGVAEALILGLLLAGTKTYAGLYDVMEEGTWYDLDAAGKLVNVPAPPDDDQDEEDEED